jgi:hypothetical protein
MNEAEQRVQQERGDALDNLVRALFTIRLQCRSTEEYRDMVADLAWGVEMLYQTGMRDPEEVIRGMTEAELRATAERV